MSVIDPLVIGQGPRHVLALHGWLGSSTGWGELPQYLDPAELTVAYLDYRGYGRRRDVLGEHSLAEISDDAQEVADHLGWATFGILAHSMGGAAAVRLLADAPARVERIAAVAAVPSVGVDLGDAQGFFEQASVDPATRRELLHVSTGQRLGGPLLDRLVAETVATGTDDSRLGHLAAWTGADVRPLLAGKTTEVLVLAGEHDLGLNVDYLRAEWLHDFPDATIELIPNAAHYPAYETPAYLGARLTRFLAGE